jgi:hypothetical protein
MRWWRGWLPERWRAPTPSVESGRQRLASLRELRRRADELVSDCEAFLVGRLAEQLEARAADVPVWVWTNFLAHGTEQDLCTERSAQRGRAGTSADAWHEARSYLATQVLDLAAIYGPLAEVQQTVLVPLEAELASRADVAGWGSRQLVGSVEAALVRRRRACRRADIRAARPPR